MQNTVNEVPEFNCGPCMDYGGYYIHHPSTDAVIGWHKCEVCPPRPPIWKYQPHFWAVSKEVWIDSPADKAVKQLTEVPF